MVSMERPSLTQALAYWLSEKTKPKTMAEIDRKLAKKAKTPIQLFIRIVFQLAGFSCLTIAGFMWTMMAGMVVAGISCFFLSWLVTGTASRKTEQRP